MSRLITFAWLCVLISTILTLTGCAGSPKQHADTKTTPSREQPSAQEQAALHHQDPTPDAAAPAPTPQHPWMLNAFDIIGQRLNKVRSELGKPNFIRKEGRAHIWRYDVDFGAFYLLAQTQAKITAMRCYNMQQHKALPAESCIRALLTPAR